MAYLNNFVSAPEPPLKSKSIDFTSLIAVNPGYFLYRNPSLFVN